MIGMFHKRLLLIACAILVLCIPVTAQLARLTIAQHEQRSRLAERALVRTRYTPTTRGSILDRKGRNLALDRASSAVAVRFDVLDGSWAATTARTIARKRHADRWPELDDDTRDKLTRVYRRVLDNRVRDALREIADITHTPLQDILETRDRIIARVRRAHESIAQRRLKRSLFEAMIAGSTLTEEVRQRLRQGAYEPIREQHAPHIILPQIPDAQAFILRKRIAQSITIDLPTGPLTIDRLPGVTVTETSDRAYPFESMRVTLDRTTLPGPLRADEPATITVEGVDTHIVGFLRDRAIDIDHARREQALEEDPELARRAIGPDGRDRGRYFPDDPAGLLGIERAAELTLRGLRGVQSTRLDTHTTSSIDPAPGQNVTLTIDINLQARIAAILHPDLGLAVAQPWHGEDNPTMPPGTPIPGCAVVLDIDTGDILAMVSSPAYTRTQYDRHAEDLIDDTVGAPLRNRVLESAYPPGSVAKAVVLVEAIAHDRFRPDERIDCLGYLDPNHNDRLRCWIYKRFMLTHSGLLGHPLDAVEGLMTSCNVFFFTLGKRLGPSLIQQAYRDFGVLRRYHLDIAPESPGLLASTTPGASAGLTVGDAVQMGIGQGPVAWTPLHAADALATIARQGRHIPPHLIAGRTPTPPRPTVPITPTTRDLVLEGLRRVIADPRMGTANHIRFPDGTEEPIFNTPPNITLWGKTGTAQAPTLFEDTNENHHLDEGETVLRQGDHSWFVLLAGTDRPRYAIAVLMEYAGSGAKVSGPIANQIVHALIDEGYLPRAD